jgi:hypothetical protein
MFSFQVEDIFTVPDATCAVGFFNSLSAEVMNSYMSKNMTFFDKAISTKRITRNDIIRISLKRGQHGVIVNYMFDLVPAYTEPAPNSTSEPASVIMVDDNTQLPEKFIRMAIPKHHEAHALLCHRFNTLLQLSSGYYLLIGSISYSCTNATITVPFGEEARGEFLF